MPPWRHPTAAPMGFAGPDQRPWLVYRASWAVLVAGVALTFIMAWLPPLYDYYHWVFEAFLVKSLIFGDGAARAAYGIHPIPVPNLTAPLSMAVLDVVFPPLVAGRIFLILGILGFAWAFAYLVRTVQGYPTALEFLGLPWALGYFLSKGYTSYLFSLPLAFVGIAWLHRRYLQPAPEVSRRDLGTFAVLGVIVYFCHLFGWLTLMAGLAVYAGLLLRRGQGRIAALLAATALPAVILLAWYAISQRGSTGVAVYRPFATNKAFSLAEGLQLFTRPDPFAALTPTFWTNLVVALLMVGLLAACYDRLRRPRLDDPAVLLAALLWVCFLILPFSSFSGLLRPDERIVLPALLVTLVALPLRRLTLATNVAAALLALLVVGHHLVEYHDVSQRTSVVEGTLLRVTPPNATVLAISIHAGSATGSCNPARSGPSIGAPTLKWISLLPMMERDRVRANLLGTALVYPKFGRNERRDVMVVNALPAEIRGMGPLGPRFAPIYSMVEAFGCGNDLQALRQALAPQYASLTAGEGFAVFSRQ